MKRILILATAGAGGDLHPLIALALRLHQRGHDLMFYGDETVVSTAAQFGVGATQAPAGVDLGPRLATTVRDSLRLEPALQGAYVRQQLATWASELTSAAAPMVQQYRPDLLITSLFGVAAALQLTSGSGIPSVVVNSTFYVGPNPPRPLESDFAARAVPLFHYFASCLNGPNMVLHATDRLFDYGFQNLPPAHHYVGPLIWEPAAPAPDYLKEAGDPWILVTLSSQQQDDLPLAQAALRALGKQPFRVLITLGPAHEPSDLGPLPANVYVEQFVPHSAVLSRSRLLISHAGHGSVMKALWYAVPMVLVPWGRDQPGVAARAEHLGVARLVPRDGHIAENMQEAALAALMDEPMQAAAREASIRLHATDAAGDACNLLEQYL